MNGEHTCTFVEEREPSGRLIVGPCLGCTKPAFSALADAQATVEALQAQLQEGEVAYHKVGEYNDHLKQQVEALRRELEHAKKMEAVQKEVADNQTWHVRELRAALDAEREKVKGLHEITKVICTHCCEPMEIPSKAALQSHLSTLQGLVETIKCELFDRHDGAPDSPTRWMGSLIRDIEIAQALPATPTERGEGHSGDDTDMVQNEGGDGE